MRNLPARALGGLTQDLYERDNSRMSHNCRATNSAHTYDRYMGAGNSRMFYHNCRVLDNSFWDWNLKNDPLSNWLLRIYDALYRRSSAL
jgi:hypothetical protein